MEKFYQGKQEQTVPAELLPAMARKAEVRMHAR
jgi:hypothetical protein